MKFPKLLGILFILSLSPGFGQSLEDTVYNALDGFIKNPTSTTLQQLEEKEVAFSTQTQKANEHLALVILNSNMGYYHRQFGNNQKAIRSYEKAWKRFREKQLEGYDIIEYCLKPLGNLYTIIGDFSNAENTIVRYLGLAKKQKNTAQIIAGIINLSVVYHNTGKHNTAIELIREGLNVKGISPQQKTALENNLATNLMALERYEEAQSTLGENLNQQYDLLKVRNAAQLAVRNNDFETALALLENAEKQLFESNLLARDIARFYVEKAKVYALKKETDKAVENYQEALRFLIPNANSSEIPRQELLYAENTFLAIFDGLALLQENRLEALRYYDLSFYVSDLLQEQYTAQEVKIIHQAALKRRTEACIEILYEHYQKTKERSVLIRAFGYAEKSKAAVLRDMVSQRSLLDSYPDDTLLQKRETFSSLLEQKINVLIREQLTTADSEKLRVLNDTLSTISLELKNLQSAIAQKYPDALSKIITLDSLQSKVEEDNAVLFSYFFGKEGLYRFDISDKEVSFHKSVVDENLSQEISQFINYFENSSAITNDVLGFKEQAHSLYKKILPKNLPKNKNLILIPDGLLHFVPFEALLTEPSQSTSFASMPFLVKKNSVTYNTSASLYHDAKTPDTKNSVLGIFPVFEGSSQPLTYSLDEAENLNSLMDSRLLMYQEASKENFIAFAKAHTILHLSTHAHSGSFTIPAAMEFYDDVMLLQEFYSLNLNPKLVVLSACETGIGKIQSGEGAMSLARGFQYAGAQNLLFSLWKVNDRSTSQLMNSFYGHYSKQHSAFMANRHSKLEYLENPDISNAKKSPYYWSGFVYYGALEEEQKKSAYSIWAIVIFGFLIILWVIIYSHFKRKNNRVKKKK
tara:strand:+ start:11685 stop:14282 length:2598 start_codon:yes stop_codon:yes gene_type:complete